MADGADPWLKRKAPGLHRFLTRRDRPFPLVRELLGIALLIVLLVGALWGFTGQPLGDRPVVVVESGSMMHCHRGDARALQLLGDACEPERFGRFGTIDPGDLIFVRDVDRRSDIRTAASGGDGTYGGPGDVIVYRPMGDGTRVPIIHRALFWLEVTHEGGEPRYTVEELGLHRVTREGLEGDARVARLVGSAGFSFIHQQCAGSDGGGFITRGDNNQGMDQGGNNNLGCPVRMEWVLGKARGEVPWIGLVNLKFNDVLGTTTNYRDAPSDTKAMMWAIIVLVVLGPVALDLVRKQRLRDAPEGDAPEP